MTDSYRPLRTHLKHPKLRNLLAVLLALLVFGKGLAAQANIVINPIFDSSITSDPNAAAIESTIRSAIQAYQAVIANPITVTITFKEMTSGLGASSSYVGTISYSSYRSALAAAPATSTKATALAHLPSGANNPVNNNANITLTTANLRALGFNATPSSGQSDGTIWLNISLLNISRTSSSSSKYDLMSAAWHEMDEVLGFGSALNGLANGASAPTGSVWPLDLFRYDQNGNRSLNTASASLSYFSLDGSMRLVGFNQDARGDFSDWYSIGSHTPRVQDAFAIAGNAPNLGIEYTALDAIGYNYQPTSTSPPPVEGAYVTSQSLGTLHHDFSGYAGMQIVVGSSPITVTALGRMMASGNTGTHSVKLVKASDGTDVAGGSVSVPMSGSTVGQYKYANLTSPVVLSAGGTYYVMSQETSGGDSWYYDDTIIKTASVATETAAAWGYGVGQWHLNGGAGQAYGPVNFKYSTSATPSTQGGYVTSQTLGTLHNTYSGYAGMRIMVGPSPITVTALGRMMASGNTASHTVKLVRASDGADVPGGSVSVPMSGGTVGQYRYGSLNAPVVLNAGASYYILSQESSGGDWWYYDDTVVKTTAVATETAGAWGYGDGEWHLNGGPGQAYGPVDFKYSVSTQEPAILVESTGFTPPEAADEVQHNGHEEVEVIFSIDAGQKCHPHDSGNETENAQ